jgi:hypothetical protein
LVMTGDFDCVSVRKSQSMSMSAGPLQSWMGKKKYLTGQLCSAWSGVLRALCSCCPSAGYIAHSMILRSSSQAIPPLFRGDFQWGLAVGLDF